MHLIKYFLVMQHHHTQMHHEKVEISGGRNILVLLGFIESPNSEEPFTVQRGQCLFGSDYRNSWVYLVYLFITPQDARFFAANQRQPLIFHLPPTALHLNYLDPDLQYIYRYILSCPNPKKGFEFFILEICCMTLHMFVQFKPEQCLRGVGTSPLVLFKDSNFYRAYGLHNLALQDA
jgi:hypothetical protein